MRRWLCKGVCQTYMASQDKVRTSTAEDEVRVMAHNAKQWIASDEGQRAIKGALKQAAQTTSNEAKREIKPESLHTPVNL